MKHWNLIVLSILLAGCNANVSRDFHSTVSSYSNGERDVTVVKNGLSRHVHVSGDATFKNDWPASATNGTTITLSESRGLKVVKEGRFEERGGKLELSVREGSGFIPATAKDEEWARAFLKDVVGDGSMFSDTGYNVSKSSEHVVNDSDAAELTKRASDRKLSSEQQSQLVEEIFSKLISDNGRKRALLTLCSNPCIVRRTREKIVDHIKEISDPDYREQILRALAIH